MEARQRSAVCIAVIVVIIAAIVLLVRHNDAVRQERLGKSYDDMQRRLREDSEKREQAGVTYAAYQSLTSEMSEGDVVGIFRQSGKEISSTGKTKVIRYNGPDGGYCEVTYHGYELVSKRQHNLK